MRELLRDIKWLMGMFEEALIIQMDAIKELRAAPDDFPTQLQVYSSQQHIEEEYGELLEKLAAARAAGLMESAQYPFLRGIDERLDELRGRFNFVKTVSRDMLPCEMFRFAEAGILQETT